MTDVKASEMVHYEREIHRLRSVNDQLRDAAWSLLNENQRLERSVMELVRQRDTLRRQLEG
jgi:predicted RNase H-like nuclease (RuvC/YqgF family)